MPLEIEKNFYNYDEKSIKSELKKMDVKYKINLLKTHKIKYNGMMVRVRDEGFRKTFTIKKKNNNNYNKEYEINVSSIKQTLTMLKLLGFKNFIYQEKIRETYFYKDSEICFDYVPGQENFIQIESKKQKELYELIKRFNLIENDERVHDINEFYGLIKHEIKDKIRFNKIGDIYNLVKKNKGHFINLINQQIHLYNKIFNTQTI